MTRYRTSVATDLGGRTANEDAWLTCPGLGVWAVADGAGGHGNGAAASRAVVTALEDMPSGLSAAEVLAQIRLRLGAVHAALLAQGETAGVTASTVVVLIVRGAHYACLWAGDSRAYRLRGGVLDQLTRDHSMVQVLLDEGVIGAAEAESHPESHVITRAVGGGGDVLMLDKVTGRLVAGDRFLLCSDGVYKALPAEALARLMTAGAEAAGVVSAALTLAAADNATAVMIDVMDCG